VHKYKAFSPALNRIESVFDFMNAYQGEKVENAALLSTHNCKVIKGYCSNGNIALFNQDQETTDRGSPACERHYVQDGQSIQKLIYKWQLPQELIQPSTLHL
jgi:hypothetical protein